MKKANKTPSEWLKLLCKEWAESAENIELIRTVDAKFESYKPYLKGKLSSQLLCRLCIPSESSSSSKESTNSNTQSRNSGATPSNTNGSGSNGSTKPDFLKDVLQIQDEFDKAYVIAQVERFCAFYDIRGIHQQGNISATAATTATTTSSSQNNASSTNTNHRFAIPNNEATTAAVAALYGDIAAQEQTQAIAAAAAATQQAQAGIAIPPHLLTADATAAAVAAAQHAAVVANSKTSHEVAAHSIVTDRAAQVLVTKAQQQAKIAERALEIERRQNAKREQKRLSLDKKMARQRDREFLQRQKKAEKLAREKAREEKRQSKLLQRQQREKFAEEQKEAALKRAADLVASNRVPIELTRASRTRKLPGVAGKTKSPEENVPKKRARSAIVVSTASDLDRIVTHSQNLWTKYNAIAKEHNKRVNWITVAKELGIHVKVREKYARMHSRAVQRKFNFVTNGHWKIKDHPEIFQEPTAAEQKARMPPPLPPVNDTVPAEVAAATIATANNDNSTNETIAIKTEGPSNSESVVPQRLQQHSDPSKNQAATAQDPLRASIPGAASLGNPLDAAAAAATAAAVVDAAGVGGATIDMHHVVELTAPVADAPEEANEEGVVSSSKTLANADSLCIV